jgi:hypothetical protein
MLENEKKKTSFRSIHSSHHSLHLENVNEVNAKVNADMIAKIEVSLQNLENLANSLREIENSVESDQISTKKEKQNSILSLTKMYLKIYWH